jgi:hypothetical protein
LAFFPFTPAVAVRRPLSWIWNLAEYSSTPSYGGGWEKFHSSHLGTQNPKMPCRIEKAYTGPMLALPDCSRLNLAFLGGALDETGIVTVTLTSET